MAKLQNAIVTGADSPLGFETVLGLVNAGFEVTLAVMNQELGRVTTDKILDRYPDAKLEIAVIDLASQQSIRDFVETRSKKSWSLLINNAAARVIEGRLLTDDGFEWHFGVNFLGHFALTGLLAPTAAEGARVVNVTSTTYKTAEIKFHDLRWDNGYRPGRAYAMSKLANLLFSRELSRKIAAAPDSVKLGSSIAAHPGHVVPVTAAPATRLVANTPESGAAGLVFAALAPDLPGGSLVVPSGPGHLFGVPEVLADPGIANEITTARRLWRLATQLTGIDF